jgi:hypothetical protein
MRILAKAIIPLSLGLLCSCATQRSHSGEALLSPGLPPEQILGEKTGTKEPLILTLRLSDGQVVPCVVDTGSCCTMLDRSLKGFLGPRLQTKSYTVPFRAAAPENTEVYKAPKLYLGNVPLMTDSTILVGRVIDTNDLDTNTHACKAILGMDCLRHYCIQIDFDEHIMRFLDSSTLKREELGLAFPLSFATNVEGAPPEGIWVPFVNFKWATNGNVRFMVDTGFVMPADFTLPPALVRPALAACDGAYWSPMSIKFSSDTANQICLFPTVVLGSETYQNVQVVELGMAPEKLLDGFMALPFLARHKVTFDFPNQKMYLRLR